ncbi:MAG: hypothetical protein ACE5HI_08850 [bacterium]
MKFPQQPDTKTRAETARAFNFLPPARRFPATSQVGGLNHSIPDEPASYDTVALPEQIV